MQLCCVCHNSTTFAAFCLNLIIFQQIRIMTSLLSLTSRSDLIGGIASIFCFLHCLATPLFFAAQAGSIAVGESHPWWWGILDLLFLSISFFAVYWSAKNSFVTWVKWTFWNLWIILALIILNEKFAWVPAREELVYIPTIGLIALHFYNRRYSRCENKECSVH